MKLEKRLPTRAPKPVRPKTVQGAIIHILMYNQKEILFAFFLLFGTLFCFLWFIPDQTVNFIKTLRGL